MASIVMMSLFVFVVATIFSMILGMVRYFGDSKESHWLTTSISTLGITLSLVYIAFIPFDIYLTSTGQETFMIPFIFMNVSIKTVYSIL
jgi:hypothetical protein